MRVASGTVGSLSMASTGVSRGEGGGGLFQFKKKPASFRMRIEQAGRSHMEVTGGLEHPGRVNTSSPGLGALSTAHWMGRGQGREPQPCGRPSCTLSSCLHLLACE